MYLCLFGLLNKSSNNVVRQKTCASVLCTRKGLPNLFCSKSLDY